MARGQQPCSIMIAKVKYQIATYSGTVVVNCSPDDENETIIARAKEKLRKQSGGSLPYGYESFEVIERV